MQVDVAGVLLLEPVEIGESVTNKHLACGCRTGKLGDGVVIFKDDIVCELTHIGETPFGKQPLAFSPPCLPYRRGNADAQRNENYHSSGHPDAVAPNELTRAIGQRVGPGRHRTPLDVPPQVVRKHLDRGVTFGRVLTQTL